MRGLLKIGFSTRPVQERVGELSAATGVPTPFEIEAYFLSTDPQGDERQIHSELEKQRVQGKEFFELEVMEAVRVVKSVCKRSPAYLNSRNHMSSLFEGDKSSGKSERSRPSTRERIMRAWRERPW
jgi:hypothetical protein